MLQVLHSRRQSLASLPHSASQHRMVCSMISRERTPHEGPGTRCREVKSVRELPTNQLPTCTRIGPSSSLSLHADNSSFQTSCTEVSICNPHESALTTTIQQEVSEAEDPPNARVVVCKSRVGGGKRKEERGERVRSRGGSKGTRYPDVVQRGTKTSSKPFTLC